MRPLVAYYFLKVLPPNSLALGWGFVYPSCGCVVAMPTYWLFCMRLLFLDFLPSCFFCMRPKAADMRTAHDSIMSLQHLSWYLAFSAFLAILLFLHATDGCTSSWKFTISLRLTSPSRLCKASSRTIEMHCWEKHDYFAILWPYLQWWHIFLVSVCVLLSEGFSS